MKLKLDENLSRYLKSSLAKLGFDVATAYEEGLLNQSDEKVARVSKQEARMIFTLDLDFSDIRRFEPGTHPGIVIFRPHFMGPGFVKKYVQKFVSENELSDFQGCLVVVEQNQIRVRSPE